MSHAVSLSVPALLLPVVAMRNSRRDPGPAEGSPRPGLPHGAPKLHAPPQDCALTCSPTAPHTMAHKGSSKSLAGGTPALGRGGGCPGWDDPHADSLGFSLVTTLLVPG